MDHGTSTNRRGRRLPLLAVAIVGLTAAGCSGSSGSSDGAGSSIDTVASVPTTVAETTTVVTASSETTTTGATIATPSTSTDVGTAATTSTTVATATSVPTTTTSTTVATATTTTATTSSMSAEEIEGLQASCVYQNDQPSCDTLTAEGFGPAGNYGLGNSLTQAPDAALGPDCWNGRTLACLEMQTRYTATAADEAVANTFATAIVANDAVTAASVAAPYIPALLVGMTALPEARDNFQFLFTPGSGFFQVGLGGGVILDCIAAEGLVRLCTYEAD